MNEGYLSFIDSTDELGATSKPIWSQMRTELIPLKDGYQINLIGKLDVLRTNYLKDVLSRDFKNKNLIFNLASLNFVGSNGILLFFSVINDLYLTHQIASEMTGLNDDFKKVIFIEKYPHLKFSFVNNSPSSFA